MKADANSNKRISFSGAGQAKRTASPLTPALSPLRGEGARRASLDYRASFTAFRGTCVSAMSEAARQPNTQSGRRTPPPDSLSP